MINLKNLLSGAKCTDIFLQPTSCIFGVDTFVINFNKETFTYSFHSFSLVRLISKMEVVYSDVDHCLNKKGTFWRRGQKKLSTDSFALLRQELVGKTVSFVDQKECGDVTLYFGQSLFLEFINDTSKAEKKRELHRLISIDNSTKKYESFVIEK